jgi:sulfatase modifying factor 1
MNRTTIGFFCACLWASSIATYSIDHAYAQEVLPPKEPKMSREPKEGSYLKGPPLTQPKHLVEELTALSQGTIEERVEKLKRKVLKDLIFLKGGTYMMGDFGPLWSKGGFNLSFSSVNKPAHKVTLTGYSLSRYKTTYAEFDVFADATQQQRGGMERRNGLYRHPLVPVGVYWQRARDYCQWLGKQTELPFDLPTEAQWEYAARSRGQNFIWATDNGNLEIGRNIASYEQENYYLSPVVATAPDDPQNVTRAMLYPVGIFPPNPMGFYEMNSDGWEWMLDWYDAGYYKTSPEHDPQGPPQGTKRSVRGYSDGDYMPGLNLIRDGDDPMLIEKDLLTDVVGPGFAATHSVRCAVNLDRAVPRRSDDSSRWK